MTETTTSEITEPCLVKIGRTGQKTHRGSVRFEVRDAGKPWVRRKILAVHTHCVMLSGVGRMGNRGLTAFIGTNPDDATCEKCCNKP